jgi:hypothetical protein
VVALFRCARTRVWNCGSPLSFLERLRNSKKTSPIGVVFLILSGQGISRSNCYRLFFSRSKSGSSFFRIQTEGLVPRQPGAERSAAPDPRNEKWLSPRSGEGSYERHRCFSFGSSQAVHRHYTGSTLARDACILPVKCLCTACELAQYPLSDSLRNRSGILFCQRGFNAQPPPAGQPKRTARTGVLGYLPALARTRYR